MKKILSLVAVFAMAVGAYAQESEEPQTETWKSSSTTAPANKTVELENIKAEFLDGTSKGSVAGAGTWTFKSGAVESDQNSMEIRFTPAVDGYLTIVPNAAIAEKKPLNMIVNEDASNTLDALYNDPDKEEPVTILNNVNPIDQGYPSGFPAGAEFTYGIKAGNTYNFYFGGTKWKLRSFSFTPGEVAGGIEADKVALLVTADAANDFTALMITEGVDWLEENPVLADATISLDDENVQAADVIVISNNVPADAAVVASLKSIVAYKPVVNLSAPLYAAWGYGEATISESKSVVLTEAYAENENLSAIAADNVVEEGTVAALALGDYFKDDAIIATVGDKPAIHIHNANRNAYIGAPISADAIPGSALTDLVIMAAKTKKGVTNTATPTFALTKSNMETSVEIKSSTAGAVIYYTEDGSEPTVASKLYTEPLVYHAETTVKAVAIADGFNLSAVAETKVEIFSQVATPEIAVAKNGATSTVTLTCATEGADIYYNFGDFGGSTKDIDLLAKKYTEPIVLSEPTMIYAKAVKQDELNSEMASYYVAIADVNASNIRLDVVSKFTADYFAWAGKAGTSAVYIWSEDPSKNQASWTEGEVKTQLPAEGATADLDWKLVSKGQKLCLESGTVEIGIGDPTDANGRGKARFFDSVEDLIDGLYSPRNFLGSKSDANEENTDNATVESTKAFTAPFDVVVYLGNGKGGEKHADLEVSEDGQTWAKAADLNVSNTVRYIKKTRVSIDKTCYVRVLYKNSDVNIADIVILNNGEESQKYDAAEYEAAGIEDVEAVGAEVVRTEIYNINGVQLPELTTGVNIVRTHYSDGSVKTEKVLSK